MSKEMLMSGLGLIEKTKIQKASRVGNGRKKEKITKQKEKEAFRRKTNVCALFARSSSGAEKTVSNKALAAKFRKKTTLLASIGTQGRNEREKA